MAGAPEHPTADRNPRVVTRLALFRGDGKPVNRKVAETSGSASLDLAGCRSAFRLKLDSRAESQAIRWVIVPVRWLMP